MIPRKDERAIRSIIIRKIVNELELEHFLSDVSIKTEKTFGASWFVVYVCWV